MRQGKHGRVSHESSSQREAHLRELQAGAAPRAAVRHLHQPAAQAAPGLKRGVARMPRILGVDIPNDKPTHISLRYIYGIGPTAGAATCASRRTSTRSARAKELTDDEISRLATHPRPRIHGRRAAAPAGAAEHRPAQGHRLLSRRAASPRPAGSRPADPDQRPHPQGAAQDGGRQEGRQGNARLAVEFGAT